jgi:uncharacterized Ntn-hydrolase superfamily protein
VAGVVALGAVLAAGPARATYSVAAVDVTTREVGGAGTSCLEGSNVYIIYGSVPGVGVVHAQALYNRAGRDRAVALLGDGSTPEEILAEITSNAFDPDAASNHRVNVSFKEA